MCKDIWALIQGEKLKVIIKPKNIEGKFAVAIMKNDCLVGHLSKEKSGRFAKIVFYFSRLCRSNMFTENH